MAIKVYISGMSGNKEVKKRQQRVLMILDSKNIAYEVVDITEPGKEEAKEFMQNNAKSMGATVGDANPRHALPPQIFNGDDYCGDYDQFDLSNEVDEIEKFLQLTGDDTVTSTADVTLENGVNGAEKGAKEAVSKGEEMADADTTVPATEDDVEEKKGDEETEANPAA